MSRIPTKVAYISRSQYITEVIMRANTTPNFSALMAALAAVSMFVWWPMTIVALIGMAAAEVLA